MFLRTHGLFERAEPRICEGERHWGNPAGSRTCAEGKGIPVLKIPTAEDVAEPVGTGAARGCSRDGCQRVSRRPGVRVVPVQSPGAAPCAGKCPCNFRSAVASRQSEQNCWKGAARPRCGNPSLFSGGAGGPRPGHPANVFSRVALGSRCHSHRFMQMFSLPRRAHGGSDRGGFNLCLGYHCQ